MSQAFLGTIRLVAFNFAPRGLGFVSGSKLTDLREHGALFIARHHLRRRWAAELQPAQSARPSCRRAGQGPGISLYNQGQAAGAETVSLTLTQAPHGHTMMTGANVTAHKPEPTHALETPGTAVRTNRSPWRRRRSARTGRGAPHENRQPFLALNYILALTVVYPSRT
jgi:microcystin-dependent protein